MAVHQHQIRVRYAETDQMGVAHHAAYVVWLEEARIAWLAARDRSYRALEESGVLMPVVELSLRYRKAARFDDVLLLETGAEALGPSRLRFATAIRRGDDLLAEAAVTIATMGRDGRPQRLPAGLVAP
jgi:acyl-CoA thioester hydrolase